MHLAGQTTLGSVFRIPSLLEQTRRHGAGNAPKSAGEDPPSGTSFIPLTSAERSEPNRRRKSVTFRRRPVDFPAPETTYIDRFSGTVLGTFRRPPLSFCLFISVCLVMPPLQCSASIQLIANKCSIISRSKNKTRATDNTCQFLVPSPACTQRPPQKNLPQTQFTYPRPLPPASKRRINS